MCRKVSVKSENAVRGHHTSRVVTQHPKSALGYSRWGSLPFSWATAFAKLCLAWYFSLGSQDIIVFYPGVNNRQIIHKGHNTDHHYQQTLDFVLGTSFCQLQKPGNSQFPSRNNSHDLGEAAPPGSCGSRNATRPDPGAAATQQSQILPINWLIWSVLGERQLLSTSHSAVPASAWFPWIPASFLLQLLPKEAGRTGYSNIKNGRRVHLLPLKQGL